MAESDPARDYLIYAVEALKFYFQNQPDVYVSGNLWLSYEQGVPDAVVCPDVFVVFGVENRPRRSYRVWEENHKKPSWILEITSASTRHKDERDKPLTYAQMGVSEYFQYDPSGDYLHPPLRGRRLVGEQYELLSVEEREEGMITVSSEVLGLDLRIFPEGQLRFFDPQRGEYLRSPEESERERLQERQRAEQERQRAEQERQRAEQAERALQELRDRLREKGIDPSQL